MGYGSRIKQARESLKLTQDDAAERIGVSRQGLRDWESEKAFPTRKHWAAIKDVLGVDILTGTMEPNAPYHVEDKYAFIRKYTAKAGAGVAQDNGHEEVDGKYAYRRDWLDRQKLQPGALVVIEAEGDSMYPTVFDGDIILIDTLQRSVVSGKVYAFRTDEGTRIKRLHKQMDGRVRVASDNPDKIAYPDEFLTPGMNVDIIGMVVHRSGGV